MSIKSILQKVTVGVVASFFALCGPANADLFNYSYTFTDGSIVSGSFSGTANGLFIDNVSNVSASFNGAPFAGSPNLFSVHYSLTDGWQNTVQPTVSFDGNLNSFMFIDSDYPTDFGYTNFFYLVNVEDESSVAVGTDISVLAIESSSNGTYDSSHWSVTAVNAVPEPETYAMLLAGLGLLGFVARRRKQKELAAA